MKYKKEDIFDFILIGLWFFSMPIGFYLITLLGLSDRENIVFFAIYMYFFIFIPLIVRFIFNYFKNKFAIIKKLCYTVFTD